MRDLLPTDAAAFVDRWREAEGAERANYVSFLNEVCDLIGVERPRPAQGGLGDYRYERGVVHRAHDGSQTSTFIDLYKRGCFVLEAKQASAVPRQASLFAQASDTQRRSLIRGTPGWAQHMIKARGQAERYAHDVPADEGWVPFLLVCDVGFCFDLYADFSGTGKNYAPFPDSRTSRIFVEQLQEPDIRERLRAIWTEPMTLDPARRRVQVTREIAALLARLAQELERRHGPDQVATFLMRCLFCMFAQSVGLLPRPDAFTALLADCAETPSLFVPLLGELWQAMNTGGFSTAIRAEVRRFNGGLYGPGHADAVEPLPLSPDMIGLLVQAARRDWADVEPAIFGTLLENALDARRRGQLGAHFTPRAFVERLVLPTVIDRLREEWDGAKAAALAAAERGQREAAADIVRRHHAKLCRVTVLDPACGTGNFLYVTLELMKRLEGEVLALLADLVPGEGERLSLSGVSVDPHQFLGLERNPRAVPVAELVLWIGWLQWHFRTHGTAPPAEPILRDFGNIRDADALLSFSGEREERDAAGKAVTRWDGRTFKVHPITGERVPDEEARETVMRPVKPVVTEWPRADFIVGNPPFIAGKDLRAELGEGYAEALWAAYPKVPKSADLAMHFWWKAAQATQAGRTRRFGFITSNSLRQTFCRRVVAASMTGRKALRLMFAIPDHPWADGRGTAAVRIALTVAERPGRDSKPGTLAVVVGERAGAEGVPEVTLRTATGLINADLSIGADVDDAQPLRANERISSPGVKLHGAGFIVAQGVAKGLGLGSVPGLERHIRPYLNGRDMTARTRGVMVVDLFGLTEDEVRRRFPAVYQHILLRVKPEREQNNRASYRDEWWVFGEPRREMRPALAGLPRYIATVETAKHRAFVFLDAATLADNRLVCIGSADALHLGVLSSRLHVAWALASGGTLEDRPVYNKTRCFDPFPFPAATDAQAARIRAVAEELDGLRKARLSAHPHLTLTHLYNVLESMRAGRPLTPAEHDTHEAGQVSVLRHLHDTLDAAVADAYGWPADLPAAEIVRRVVALNRERRAEETAGLVRWLRPEFQATEQRRATQPTMDVDATEAEERAAWPATAPEQFVALRAALAAGPLDARAAARRFGTTPGRLRPMLETLAALGQARADASGRYVA